MNDFFDSFPEVLGQLREKKPLVHHITNFVTMQDCANLAVAIGASPVMAFCREETGEIAAAAHALVLNAGTPDPGRFLAMCRAGKQANKKGIPVILDPVGAGASAFRKTYLEFLMKEVHIDIIKGNAAEIKVITGIQTSQNNGVDSREEVDAGFFDAIKQKAEELKSVIAVTGETDCITDGKQSCFLKRGSAFLAQISGSGCMTATLIGCFSGVCMDPFLACCYGVFAMSLAGELAEERLKPKEGAGMFKVRLFDAVNTMTGWERRNSIV